MSIYHLHIPRTSGVYVRSNVVPGLKSNGIKHFASNRSVIDVEQIKESQFVSGHFGLMPLDYMDDPLVFTIVREPVERFISYFNYTIKPQQTKRQIEERLNEWLYGKDSIKQSNLQAKFLTGKTNIDKYNEDVLPFETTIESGWHIEGYTLDIKHIIKNLKQMKCYTLDELNLFKTNLNESLINQFGFSSFADSKKINASFNNGIKFNKEQINKVKELNALDIELYEYVKGVQK